MVLFYYGTYVSLSGYVMINIDLSETAQKVNWKSETTSKTNFF